MNDRAEPHSSRRTGVLRRWADGSRARWIKEGSAGVALARNGNSSMTTGFAPPVAMRISRVIASSHPANRKGTGSRI